LSKSPVKNKPVSGARVPRFAGVATFMRLPHVRLEDAGNVDIGLIGIPWDGGTTNRAGARHGPRQVREMSSLMRNVHPVTLVKPYELANCADLGDVDVQPIDPADALARIEQFFLSVRDKSIVPVSVGGDHLTTLPVLRALADGRRLSLVHIDAHSDTNDVSFGRFKYTHGTPFRRAIEEGLIDPKRMIQIGIRGSLYAEDDFDWARAQGIRIVPIEEFHDLGFAEVAKLAQAVVGSGPAYLSFDIDALDPAFAPGTGTPEAGGMSTLEAQRLVRGLRGINFIGADLVEVAPPFDPAGNTAIVAATLVFEILCLLAEQLPRA
jgi:guanidinopropionase